MIDKLMLVERHPKYLAYLLLSLIIVLITISFIGCSSSSDQEKEDGQKSIFTKPANTEEELLASGLEAYDRGLYSLARERFNTLRIGYPASYWTTLAQLKIADAQFYSENYTEAAAGYEEFANEHPSHEALPYVRFQLGLCYLRQYRNNVKDQAPLHTAIKKFRELIKVYPNSAYVVQARRYIQRCRDLLADYELLVARFYIKQGQRDAAQLRLFGIKDLYPESSAAIAAQEIIQQEFANQKEKSGPKIKSDKKLDELVPQTPEILH